MFHDRVRNRSEVLRRHRDRQRIQPEPHEVAQGLVVIQSIIRIDRSPEDVFDYIVDMTDELKVKPGRTVDGEVDRMATWAGTTEAMKISFEPGARV